MNLLAFLAYDLNILKIRNTFLQLPLLLYFALGAHLEYRASSKLFLLKAGNMEKNLDLNVLSNLIYI